MGFDLHGVAPKEPKENKTEIEYLGKRIEKINTGKIFDGRLKQTKVWDLQSKVEELSPGIYFRNNVWWWRPLWSYICDVCSDILSDKDMEGGSWNNGYTISGTKANKIAKRIQEEMKNGNLDEFVIGYKKMLDDIKPVECDICDGTGKRQKAPKLGAGNVFCNGCSGKGERDAWGKNYPFNIENVIEFANFVKHSGGFMIC